MNAGAVIEVIVILCMLVGTAATILSSIGVIRLPDVYTRAHATTKATTLGLLFILLGTFIYFLFTHEKVSVRLILGIIFVYLTAPVAGHMATRSAHRSRVALADISVCDDLQRDLDLEQQDQEPGKARV